MLRDPGLAGVDGLALDIAFGTDLSLLTLDFATADFGTPSPLRRRRFHSPPESARLR